MRFVVLFSALTTAAAFVLHQQPSFVSSSHTTTRNRQPNSCLKATAKDSKAGESEVERLLRRAKELRAKAEEAEHEVHDSLAKKKMETDNHTDQLIDHLFFESPQSKSGLVDRLRSKRLCIDTLETIVDRLDEREVMAEGKGHVEARVFDDHTEFERVAQRDEVELERITGLINDLIEGVKVLDGDFMAEKEQKGEVHVTHTEEQHWGGGKTADRLYNRSHEMRREREEQFQKRVEELREAQRLKEGQLPPPKS